MIRTNIRRRPSLEPLESRWVPATIRLVGGNLFVSTPASNPVDLKVVSTGVTGEFNVIDGLKTVKVSGVGGLIAITGSNKLDTITFDVGATAFGGSLLVNSGNGNDTISVTAAGGKLLGRTVLLSGRGNDTLLLNADAAAGAMTFGGPITLVDTLGNDTVSFGNAAGVSAFRGPVNVIGGNFLTFGFGQTDSYGSNLNVTTLDAFGIDMAVGNPAGLVTISGSVSATGGSADDVVLLADAAVAGNITANLGGAATVLGNELALGNATPLSATVGGSVRYSGGVGRDRVDFVAATIGGDATLYLGEGPDEVLLDLAPTINGNLNVFAGNGDVDFGPLGDITATVGGNALFSLGNGNSTISWGVGSSIGGRLIVRTGNGNTTLNLLADQTYLVDIAFGNGDNTLTLNHPNLVLTGVVRAGSGSNTLNQINGLLLPTLYLINFP